MELPDADIAHRLAQCFAEHEYSVDGVQNLLGAVASAALARDELVPARRVLRADGSGLALLVRLFLLSEAVEADDASRTLGSLAELSDLIAVSGSQVRATVEVAPHQADDANWWIAADWPTRRTGAALQSDHVLGVGGASTMLVESTVRRDIDSALDVGTGCGIQALHLAQHARQVLATDVSERCLAIARFNAGLNDVKVDFVNGSLLSPVQGQTFDTIVSNPPFVIGSPGKARHTYRDAGMPGDEVCAALVSQAHQHLRPDGFCQLLANWEITDPDDWAKRPRQWLSVSPLDAWVIQRDVQDPAAYVATWLTDAGEQFGDKFERHYDEWLNTLESRGVVGIGFGLITLRAGSAVNPIREFQHAAQPLVQPIGPDIGRWFAAHDFLAARPDRELLAAKLRCSTSARVTREKAASEADAQGSTREAISAWRTQGMAWSAPMDELGVQLLAAADGGSSVGSILQTLADRNGLDSNVFAEQAMPLIRRLVVEGFLWLPSEETQRQESQRSM